MDVSVNHFKDFTKPYVFVMTTVRRRHFLTSYNQKMKLL